MHPRYTGTYTAILITVYAKPLSLVPLWATYSVRSRGRAESPAAWRDPVAFENGTRPDTTSPCPLCCLHRRNKARKSAGSYIYIYDICTIIRPILISACQFLPSIKERSLSEVDTRYGRMVCGLWRGVIESGIRKRAGPCIQNSETRSRPCWAPLNSW